MKVQKRLFPTNPNLADTDGDGLNDWEEINVLGSNPIVNTGDLDRDRLKDNEELLIYKTNISNPDTDGDGLNDWEEINLYFTDPLSSDSDGDELSDFFEIKGIKNEDLASTLFQKPSYYFFHSTLSHFDDCFILYYTDCSRQI